MQEYGTYYRLSESGEKIYYVDNKEVGIEFLMVKKLMSEQKVSSSIAHKIIKKIKEFKENK
jgi:hypothetical protein